jgi:signal transduction histidine kinase
VGTVDVTADRGGVRAAPLAAVRGFALTLLSLGGSLALFVAGVLSIAFIVLGVGVFTTPWVLAAVRAQANLRRALSARWAGLPVDVPYRPLPGDLRPGVTGVVERCTHLLKDPATWRDLLWLLIDAVAGFVTALLPPALIAYGVWGYVLPAGVWQAVSGSYWYAFIPVTGGGSAVLCAMLGTALLATAAFVNAPVLRGHFLLAGVFLAPTRNARLARRVAHLDRTRHDAVDSSAAQLRRIERDLHDGAQARLVAMGMNLGAIEALVETDPARAKPLRARARADSADALGELRDLVRGIHPPVLAERGLGDAARALALRMQLPVEVDVDLPGRFDESVEAAAYFALSEVLTNAAKHAQASRVWVDVHYSEPAGGMLRIAVTDDGRGGARPDSGGGLAGLRRRLGAFDGVLAVSSPAGGPTMVTLEIPCAPMPVAGGVSRPSAPRR